jgi:two-component sensor histidine kinase
VSNNRFFRAPALIAGIYFLFGFLWILLSDSLLAMIFQDIELYRRFQTLKGWIYVVLTTVLVYLLVRTYAVYKERLLVSLAGREREARDRLAEKELLVREVHHRVKNNMQMIQSMIQLNLQKDHNDPAELMEDLNKRIYSMALIHEQMYKTGDPRKFSIDEYLNELISNIHGVSASRDIQIHSAIDPVPLEDDEVIPCGIIINEILTNCFKYAFPGSGKGNIWVRFLKDGGRKLLEIRDDGVGFDPLKARQSFGLLLIEILAQQLKGELSVQSGPQGTRFSLVFPQENTSSVGSPDPRC